MHNGKKTIGKDGVEYRSFLEAQFSNAFLYEKYKYEYEKPYNNSTKYTCDFYLPLINTWIEIVPYEHDLFEEKIEIISQIPFSDIRLDVCFRDKEIVKACGARWNNDFKGWCIDRLELDFWANAPLLSKFVPNNIIELYKNPKKVKTYVNKNLDSFSNFKQYKDCIEEKRVIVKDVYDGFFLEVTKEDIRRSPTVGFMLQKEYKNFDYTGWKLFRMMEHNCVSDK